MRKIVLIIALAVTTGNFALGVAYAAVCESKGGSRGCGATCIGQADGGCTCTGSCTADELKWVDGAGGSGEEELLAQ